jgi:glycosyltransferase involved in cell wall biosynthesis
VPAYAWELIVVDCGSRDDTPQVLSKYRERGRLPLSPIWLNEACSHAMAWNIAIRQASGNIAVMLHDTCIVNPDFVSNHLKHHRNHDQVVIGNLEMGVHTHLFSLLDAPIDGTSAVPGIVAEDIDCDLLDILSFRRGNRRRFLGGPSGIVEDRDLYWALFSTANVSAPITRLIELGGLDNNFFGWGIEDIELGYRLYLAGLPFTVEDDARAMRQLTAPSHLDRHGLGWNIRLFFRKHPNIDPAIIEPILVGSINR